jgi:hypothetical protein
MPRNRYCGSYGTVRFVIVGNASGQRLRDDWRGNPSVYDDEIGDMEGFEIQQLRNEVGRE